MGEREGDGADHTLGPAFMPQPGEGDLVKPTADPKEQSEETHRKSSFHPLRMADPLLS